MRKKYLKGHSDFFFFNLGFSFFQVSGLKLKYFFNVHLFIYLFLFIYFYLLSLCCCMGFFVVAMSKG